MPKYVQACESKAWHIHTWSFDPTSGEVRGEQRKLYKCHSWRHEGECRRWRAAQNFSRISKALEPARPRDVVYLVLTLDRSKWKDRWEAFGELSERWKALRKAITREYGKNEWVATVEVHRSGWPHMNVVLWCPTLADQLSATRNVGAAVPWLRRHAVQCGFGRILTVERAHDRRALAGYVVKVASEVETAAKPDAEGRLVGEVIKLSQLPVEAKKHFRRLRSSVGFLPKPFKSENVGGALMRMSLEEVRLAEEEGGNGDGDRDPQPLEMENREEALRLRQPPREVGGASQQAGSSRGPSFAQGVLFEPPQVTHQAAFRDASYPRGTSEGVTAFEVELCGELEPSGGTTGPPSSALLSGHDSGPPGGRTRPP